MITSDGDLSVFLGPNSMELSLGSLLKFCLLFRLLVNAGHSSYISLVFAATIIQIMISLRAAY